MNPWQIWLDANGGKTNPAIRWIDENGGRKLLIPAIARCVPLKPCYGLNGKPEFLRGPPLGPNTFTAIILGRHGKGALRCVASNEVELPEKPDTKGSSDFFAEFDALRSTAKQIAMIEQIIGVAASGDHADQVRRLLGEARRFRAQLVAIVILDGDRRLAFFDIALIELPPQFNPELAFTSKVAP